MVKRMEVRFRLHRSLPILDRPFGFRGAGPLMRPRSVSLSVCAGRPSNTWANKSGEVCEFASGLLRATHA